jgi:ankyrin repeat protein
MSACPPDHRPLCLCADETGTGARVNHRNVWGQSSLYLACTRGHVHIVQSLLTWGAEVSLPTLQGKDPLMAAAAAGHTQVSV